MNSPTISKATMAQKEARPMICHWESGKNESSKVIEFQNFGEPGSD
jgi:hypothetical protein